MGSNVFCLLFVHFQRGSEDLLEIGGRTLRHVVSRRRIVGVAGIYQGDLK